MTMHICYVIFCCILFTCFKNNCSPLCKGILNCILAEQSKDRVIQKGLPFRQNNEKGNKFFTSQVGMYLFCEIPISVSGKKTQLPNTSSYEKRRIQILRLFIKKLIKSRTQMPLIFIEFAVTLTALGPFSLPSEKTIDFNPP